MRPLHHVVVSTAVSGVYSLKTGDWKAITACFLSGILIDLDHHLDYVIHRKKIPWRYKDLWDFCENDLTWKLYLVFHSYELLALFWLAIYHFRLGEIFFATALGLTVHIVLDEIFNPLRPFAYFTTVRWLNGFKQEKLFKEGYLQSKRLKTS